MKLKCKNISFFTFHFFLQKRPFCKQNFKYMHNLFILHDYLFFYNFRRTKSFFFKSCIFAIDYELKNYLFESLSILNMLTKDVFSYIKNSCLFWKMRKTFNFVHNLCQILHAYIYITFLASFVFFLRSFEN